MLGARVPRIRKSLVGMLAVFGLLPAACAGSGAVQTTSAEGGGGASFEGETLHFVVSFEPGGGYDTIARAIAPYLEKELGATVVVENEDGAGGLLAANEIYAAEPDGTTFGFFAGQGIAGAAIAEAEGVQFDLEKFSYVARLSAEQRVLVSTPGSKYQTIDDVRSGQGVKFASAGVGAADQIDAAVLYPLLGIDGRIVTGFEGSDDTELAITKGDVNIGSGTIASRMEGIDNGDLHPVLILGTERSDSLPGVPTLMDVPLSPEKEAFAQMHLNLQRMGRMVWAPPGVPEDRRQALQDAFEAACRNPDFLAKMRRAEETVDFTGGDEAKAVAADVLDAPQQYKAQLKRAFAGS
jgi:tripartite-type tricarboxylate transporter receptor subunit TctC